MSLRYSSEQIKAEAVSLGFSACGVAEAAPVDASHAAVLHQWLADEGHAGMDYMARNVDKRLDPRLLMDGVRSIVSVALNYTPARRLPDGEPQIAAYALGRDYHDIVKSRLHALAARIGADNYRAFCDTAPVMERYWAVRAGIGWIGRNHLLTVPNVGNMVFLGELFLDEKLDYDTPLQPRCGTCRACLAACPSSALSADGSFCSAKCLSYLTIEHRSDLPEGTGNLMGNTFYGCDRCSDACPWNRFATPTDDPLLQPSADLTAMTSTDWLNLTPDRYRQLFKGSAMKRAKYAGLMRNIHAALTSADEKKHEMY